MKTQSSLKVTDGFRFGTGRGLAVVVGDVSVMIVE